MKSSPITILKFGGTSVQDANAMNQLVDIVRTRSGRRLVVVSALAKVTDTLVKIAECCEQKQSPLARQLVKDICDRHLDVAEHLKLSNKQILFLQDFLNQLIEWVENQLTLGEMSPKAKDHLLSFGELCSSCLVQGVISKKITSFWVDARDLIATNSEFNSAQVDRELTRNNLMEKVVPHLDEAVGVTQGFIGSDGFGNTTTLGRGGSDYSAALMGAGLDAEKVEIWTDVDGILSTDPRIVKNARVIDQLHFLEAAEMAYFGAKVIHPKTIFPALEKKISVWILNSKNPSAQGTEITYAEDYRSKGVTGIAFKKEVTLVNIYSTRMLGAHGFLKSVFDIFARHKLSVDLIATSEVNLSLTLDPNSDLEALNKVKQELESFSEVEVHGHRGMISVVGGGIRKTPGLALKIFSHLSDINIQMVSMGASELNLSFVVHSDEVNEVIKRLHQSLIES
ncbi:MAG: lysine-sensitive aspartokinase 3 [Bdellovibrionales bacterium]|nr:lysine-sensitive aspartokinase 3 [Bdellovibrionales bacterium]